MTQAISPGAVSPGLWALAWRRLRADRIAMAALAVVGLFLLTLALSSAGLIAADWEREVGVNYAPPSFLGPGVPFIEEPRGAVRAPLDNAFDPLADDLRALRAELEQGRPLGAPAPAAKRDTLPFGADKWGHDIVKKTIKGGETSIVVGLVAALLAVSLGTLFGAISGFYGGLVDDVFNWFYSIFTSIPSILMILTVAAVLQQKGVLTIVLILGLTGWTGPYRLIRAEY
ncbi:MAG TPA: ABC transporter permease subunit, partial [Telluria sp.]